MKNRPAVMQAWNARKVEKGPFQQHRQKGAFWSEWNFKGVMIEVAAEVWILFQLLYQCLIDLTTVSHPMKFHLNFLRVSLSHSCLEARTTENLNAWVTRSQFLCQVCTEISKPLLKIRSFSPEVTMVPLKLKNVKKDVTGAKMTRSKSEKKSHSWRIFRISLHFWQKGHHLEPQLET